MALRLWLQQAAQQLHLLRQRSDADGIALQEVTDALLCSVLTYLRVDLWQVLAQTPSHPEDLFVFEAGYYTVLLLRKHIQF